MSGVVYDSSLYIAALRLRRPDLLDLYRYGGGPLYLSSVVAQELYVGAGPRAKRRDLDQLWHRFEGVGRLLVPTANDWRETGLVLAQIGERLGYDRVRDGRLTNDALLALSARRLGLIVVTANVRDFDLLGRHRSFRLLPVDPQRTAERAPC
ncbi:MAG: type II toxin-antitoxin system VapC family toxin [Chloroflexi bacterium]|nr:type II toxin-antitoxin system VapC family toxin [Chloroflexota bacterium]